MSKSEKKDALNFESALTEIDQIVAKLESGEISLDESLQMFQRGMELINFCSGKLEAVEAKLKVIFEGEGGFKLEDGE
jgi:exodeoxyribonuclease VII small subunit